MSLDNKYMQQALKLAEKGRYRASPNPMVGCVIVKNHRIVGEGWHLGPKTDHAEVMALKHAGTLAQGADIYVTLEPCCHFGHTPPCTDALIQARVKRVFIAVQDSNPIVNGNGIALLQKSGITVHTGILSDAAEKLNQHFFHFMRQQRPYVICKWAMSLNGKTITAKDDSKQITNHECQTKVHLTRCQVDAILIGANTALDDNPQLTTRLPDNLQITARHPLRIVLDSHGRCHPDLKIFDPSMPGKTLVATTHKALDNWKQTLQSQGVDIVVLPTDTQKRVCLHSLMAELYQRQITSLLVEGGMTTHESFIAADLVNAVHAYIAPVLIGDMVKKMPLQSQQHTALANNFFIQAHHQAPDHLGGTACTQV